MIRATTGGVMKTYRSSLMNSFINMNKSMNTILTQRTFNSFAEDPAAAAKAFRLRKSRMTLESQYDICTDVHKKYQTAVACLQSIDDVLCTKDGVYGQYMTTLTGTTLSMLNDPEGDAREQLSKVLDQMAQEIIQTMNQKYGDNFIFAGADGHNVPFEIKDDVLYYRGVPVDASDPNVWKDADGNPIYVTEDGEYTTEDTGLYLKMDNVAFLTPEEYEALITKPDVVMNEDGTFPQEYNEDGEPVEVHNEENGGGYYRLLDENGNPIDGPEGLIPVKEYDEAVNRANNAPTLLKRAATEPAEPDPDNPDPDPGFGVTHPVYVWVDESGNVVPDGDENAKYVAVFYGEPQTMTKEDYEQQKQDWEKLQYLAQETNFVDIGYGFQEDPVTGKLIESSAFNAALNGISFIGYGLDEDGDPKNLYSLVQRMREVAGSVSSGTDWDSETWDEFNRLVGKFEDGVSNYQTEFVNLDASTGKLSSQVELLQENADNVWEQYSNIEDVDMAEAITAFLWAQYSYNAALRVGNSVLSQSLMDYLS